MRPVLLYAGTCALIAALFLLFPGIDLAATRLFYDSAQGFFLADSPPVRIVEAGVPWIVRAMIVLAVIAALWLGIARRPLWRLDGKALVFLVASIALGPGLIANTVLKDHWGRARPNQVVEFGGARQFTPAPLPAEQCARNCAFVSGHAALGFSLVGFALLLPLGWRRRAAIAGALAFGGLVGLGRIAAGKHFLSDVVFAGLIVCATSWLLYQAIVARDLPASPLAQRAHRAFGRLTAASLGARLALWGAAVVLIEIAAIGWIDRPLATYFREHDAARPFFAVIGPFGLALPYLVVLAIGFAALRWGGSVRRLEPRAERMRTAARIPGVLFASIALSGIIVDLLKVVVGRPRPKLLFASGAYEFSWIGLGADHWSFPSGHAATAAALATALWCLWPEPLLLYAIAAALVAMSRVVMGAHYLSDVIMGAFIGIVVSRGLAAGYARGRLPFRLRPSPAPEPVLPPGA
jgi:lipid A 4'-phosphatase